MWWGNCRGSALSKTTTHFAQSYHNDIIRLVFRQWKLKTYWIPNVAVWIALNIQFAFPNNFEKQWNFLYLALNFLAMQLYEKKAHCGLNLMYMYIWTTAKSIGFAPERNIAALFFLCVLLSEVGACFYFVTTSRHLPSLHCLHANGRD